MQGAVSVERQVTKSATVSATYLNSRGFDQFLTLNANAPFPGRRAIHRRPQSQAATSTVTSPKAISSRTS